MRGSKKEDAERSEAVEGLPGEGGSPKADRIKVSPKTRKKLFENPSRVHNFLD